MLRTTIKAIIIIWTLVLVACSSHSNQSGSRTIAMDPPSAAIVRTDSLINPKEELTKIYTLAISDYIKAVQQEYQITFDTLFFGKHVYGQPDDFPDIILPENIAQTPIRLITPEVGSVKQKERKSLVYINLIGFVEPDKADFIFVNFSNFGEHQFDCYINYRLNPQISTFELEGMRFENFLYKKK